MFWESKIIFAKKCWNLNRFSHGLYYYSGIRLFYCMELEHSTKGATLLHWIKLVNFSLRKLRKSIKIQTFAPIMPRWIPNHDLFWLHFLLPLPSYLDQFLLLVGRILVFYCRFLSYFFVFPFPFPFPLCYLLYPQTNKKDLYD